MCNIRICMAMLQAEHKTGTGNNSILCEVTFLVLQRYLSPPFSFPKSKVSCYVADKAVGFYVKEVGNRASGRRKGVLG